jgi:AcrR family transcriptional regulator
MGATLTARERARAELVTEIKDAARRQLGEVGAPALSLRAVARDLGMVSSAIYRYFPSRDDLLSALIVDAYDSLGDAAERAEAKARKAGADPGTRWLATCRAVRVWALANQHEFALIFGSPVPGYRAPQDTVQPAARIPLLMAGILAEAVRAGLLHPPRRPLPQPPLIEPELLAEQGPFPPELRDLVERSLTMWVALIGTITFELFGHLHKTVSDYRGYFDRAMVVAAEAVGLDIDLPPST